VVRRRNGNPDDAAPPLVIRLHEELGENGCELRYERGDLWIRGTKTATRVLQRYASYPRSLYLLRNDEIWWRIINYDREQNAMTTIEVDRDDIRNLIIQEVARQLRAPVPQNAAGLVNVYKYLQDTLERRVIDLERRMFELENRLAEAKKESSPAAAR
jgi:hypothetical protein